MIQACSRIKTKNVHFSVRRFFLEVVLNFLNKETTFLFFVGANLIL